MTSSQLMAGIYQSPAVVTTPYIPPLRLLWHGEFPKGFLDVSCLVFAFAPRRLSFGAHLWCISSHCRCPPSPHAFLAHCAWTKKENCYPQAMQRPATLFLLYKTKQTVVVHHCRPSWLRQPHRTFLNVAFLMWHLVLIPLASLIRLCSPPKWLWFITH